MTTKDSTINPDIFKAYDVRGVYEENLTEEAVYRIGRAAALYLNVPEIAVCRDMRVSSPQLAAAAIRGITDQGVNVIDCGLTTTDELYFIVGYYHYPAGIRRDTMQLAWKVAEDSKVKLKDYDPDAIDTYTDRALAAAELELALLEQLGHTKPGNHENKRSKKVQKAHAAT